MSVESLTTTDILVNNIQSVVSINNHASMKLSVTNYLVCKVQLKALLIAYDLVGYVDGTKTCRTSKDVGIILSFMLSFPKNYNIFGCKWLFLIKLI
jgi:hypothetical protein